MLVVKTVLEQGMHLYVKQYKDYIALVVQVVCICVSICFINGPCMNYRAVFRAHSSSSRAEMMILL